MITIKFIKNSILENDQHQIPKSIIQKYPYSVFNFCTDFDTDVIELDTNIIDFGEFGEVIDVLNGTKHYWDVYNDRIILFMKKYGLIDNIFETYESIQKNRTNKEMLKLHNFIYGDGKYYAAKDIEFQDALKYSILKNNHIISVQTVTDYGLRLININETIPIYSNAAMWTGECENILNCANNEIDILQSRYQCLCEPASFDKHIPLLYSDDNEKYLSCCAFFIDRIFGTRLHLPFDKLPNVNGLDIEIMNEKCDIPSRIFKWDDSILALFNGDVNKLIEIVIHKIKYDVKNITSFYKQYEINTSRNGHIWFYTLNMDFFFLNLKNIQN